MAVLIRRLRQSDGVQKFDCGDHQLNDYLRRHAWANQSKNLIGVTYVSVDADQPTIVLGYYTLAVSAIARDHLPAEFTRDLPRYQNLPVALLARLAVDRHFQNSGLGKSLLRHAFVNVLGLAKRVGCRYLIVDAYSAAVAWYARFGFVPIGEKTPSGMQRLAIDLRTVAGSLS